MVLARILKLSSNLKLIIFYCLLKMNQRESYKVFEKKLEDHIEYIRIWVNDINE